VSVSYSRLPVVVFKISVQRKLILDIEIDVDGPGVTPALNAGVILRSGH
jgi:hypothetical protein